LLKVVVFGFFVLALSSTSSHASQQSDLDSIAESYVKLVLDVGLYDDGYVDFYYGPQEWIPEPLDSSEAAQFPYEPLKTRASELISQLDSWHGDAGDELERARWSFLKAHVKAVATRIDMLGGRTLSFNEESQLLFGVRAPSFQIDDFKSVIAELDSLIPGSGDLRERLSAYRKRFVIPPEKVATVMQTALDSSRSRTREHLDLPDGDSCSLVIVTDKPWRAFNSFKGNSTSGIELNVDLPVRIGMAMDYACHEGYPGHHVHASLWEEKLYRGKGWIEFSISPLYAPSSLLAEGIAECAADMVFPGDEALNFEKEVLFPLAGLDPDEAERYRRVRILVDSLKWGLITLAQKYLDGEISRDEAVRWLTDYTLMSPAAAERTIPLVEMYRSYAVTYKLGKMLVENWIDNNAGVSGNSKERWQKFYELMSTPKIPAQL